MMQWHVCLAKTKANMLSYIFLYRKETLLFSETSARVFDY